MMRALASALLLLSAGAILADPPNAEPHRTLLVLEPSSSRSVFRTDRAAPDVELCVTQVNRLARDGEPLLPGDRFAFRLPPGCVAFTGSCVVETDSAALAPSDVLCVLRPDSLELTVLASAALAPGDSVCAIVTVEAPSPGGCAAEFRLTPRAAALPPHQPHGVHRIANVAQPSFLTWDVVDPLSGPTGTRGSEGPTGAVGAVGEMGPVGAIGATGAVGAVGNQGPIGALGESGPTGVTGAGGAPGPVGFGGPPGATGPEGPSGSPGPHGATGPGGPAGLAGPRGAQGPPGAAGTGTATDCRKLFYLTRTLHHADEAPTACEPGFHFASGAEVGEWTHLRYDTGRGLQAEDSGYGPPVYDRLEDPPRSFTHYMGWMRTSHDAFSPFHCEGWTVRDPSMSGHAAYLRVERSVDWTSHSGSAARCGQVLRVWCVED